MSESEILAVQPSSSLARAASSLASRHARSRGTVYLLLDTSYSMSSHGKLAQLQRGSLKFFAEAWQRGYAVGAVDFGSRAACLVGATRNFYTFQKRIYSLWPDGRTAMDSAIRLGTWRLRFQRGYRAMILITDGQPDDPAATLQAASVARQLGIDLIAVGTSGADEAFLASLTPKPELASVVETGDLEASVARAALVLPES
jgi:Mg-chelatase subunit ChlD